MQTHLNIRRRDIVRQTEIRSLLPFSFFSGQMKMGNGHIKTVRNKNKTEIVSGAKMVATAPILSISTIIFTRLSLSLLAFFFLSFVITFQRTVIGNDERKKNWHLDEIQQNFVP